MYDFRRRKAGIALAVLVLLAAGCQYLAPRGRTQLPSAVDGGIRFRYFAPAATRVQLAGGWPGNNWSRGDGSVGEADIGLMKKGGDGMWEIVVALPPGRHHYLFRVDENTWHLDPGNPEEVDGGPVGRVSQLIVFLRDGQLEVR